jgi:8-oxo-dGTP pyrophosphatase MutT (NUDIX family)
MSATSRKGRPSDRFIRLSQLRKLSVCEQVAAVCYRVRNDAHNGTIEFLLVRTRGGGRWTFPKGSAEPGLTQAQAAALEAFEEAGVHGRIEEASFARYRRKRDDGRDRASKAGE